MSKLEDTLRKDGWELIPCTELKPGDYIAVIGGHFGASEGLVSEVFKQGDGWFCLFYGADGVQIFRDANKTVWRAPKKYEHLEVRWDTDGTKYINVSTDPRQPAFCLASHITVKQVFNPGNRRVVIHYCENPESLLKEKP